MLILLPPSQGKAPTPRTGAPVDLTRLGSPELTEARRAVLAALVELCKDSATACLTLGLGPTQADEVARNHALLSSPALPAAKVYTGVLYDAFGPATLDRKARRWAERSVLVSSALWGVVRLTDRIPPYRLSVGTALPPLGPLARHWRPRLAEVLPGLAGQGVVLDLRSSPYAATWQPRGETAERTAAVRVLSGGRTVSHFNKATKGLLVRRLAGALAAAPEPGSVKELADLVAELGFDVVACDAADGRPWRIDIETG